MPPELLIKHVVLAHPENDAILEFKQRVSNSNITKIEGMRFCDEQITLSMKTMFVRENNAIKMT